MGLRKTFRRLFKKAIVARLYLVRTQKFSEKAKAPPTLIEKESFGCFL
jgi:hypothetical protein